MPQRIHLIEKIGYIKKVGDNVFESGFWDVPAGTAEALYRIANECDLSNLINLR